MSNAHSFDSPDGMVSSEDRQHVLSADCWCQPDIRHITGRDDETIAELAARRAQEKHPPLVADGVEGET